MEVSGQLHAAAALLSRKEPPVLGGTQRQSGLHRVSKTLLPLSGVEPRRYADCAISGPEYRKKGKGVPVLK
jgi:hypothetical protein